MVFCFFAHCCNVPSFDFFFLSLITSEDVFFTQSITKIIETQTREKSRVSEERRIKGQGSETRQP